MQPFNVVGVLYAAFRDEEHAIRNVYFKAETQVVIHGKVFEIPVVYTDDICPGLDGHFYLLLIVGLDQGGEAKLAAYAEIFGKLPWREYRADKEDG